MITDIFTEMDCELSVMKILKVKPIISFEICCGSIKSNIVYNTTEVKHS